MRMTLVTCIAGGEGEGFTVLTTVEVMNTDTLQWSTASSLPYPLYGASATVCRDSVYLLATLHCRISPYLLSE